MKRLALNSLLLGVALTILTLSAPAHAAKPTPPPISASIDSPTLKHGQSATITVTAQIPEGFHAQSHTPTKENYIPYVVTMTPTPGIEFGDPVYPKGEDHDYPALGTLNIYEGKVDVTVPLKVKPDAPAGPVTLGGKVRLQMCDDKTCYFPMTPAFTVAATIEGAPTAASAPTTAPTTAPALVTPEQKEWTIWTALGVALLAGLLFNVMPCVLPVLPLKAIGFYEVSQHHRARSFALGVVFSLGIISVFAALSLVVLVFRFITWGELFTKWWFVWLLLVPLLTIMGLGLLGGWNFSLPLGVYRFEPRHDTFGGNFFWGGLTAILATPCTAPLLPPLLIWAAAQAKFVGVLSVMTVGVGMALPYLILSAMPELARKFPRTGPWSDLFKQEMGFLMLAAATYFAAGRLIAGPQFFWAVVLMMAIASVFLMARTVQLTPNAMPVAVVSVLAVALVAAPLWWTMKITAAAGQFTHFTDESFKQARDAGKPVLVKFTANWCSTCQVIEGTVFRDDHVWQVLRDRGFEVMKVDFSTSEDVPGHDLLLELNPAGGIPLTAIYTPGNPKPLVLSSVYTSEELLDTLGRATNVAHASAE